LLLLCRRTLHGRESRLLVAVLQVQTVAARRIIFNFGCQLLGLGLGLLKLQRVALVQRYRVRGQRVIECGGHAKRVLILAEHLIGVPAVGGTV